MLIRDVVQADNMLERGYETTPCQLDTVGRIDHHPVTVQSTPHRLNTLV